MATQLSGPGPVISFRSAQELKRAPQRGVPQFKKYFIFLSLLATLAALPYALSSLAGESSSIGEHLSLPRCVSLTLFPEAAAGSCQGVKRGWVGESKEEVTCSGY